MWLPWRRNKNRAAPSPSFSCSSFKDVQILCKDIDEAQKSPLNDKILPPKPSYSIFHRVRIAASSLRSWRNPPPPSHQDSTDPNRIVLYFTTLRVVRRTFDDCSSVRSILRGLRLTVDERDVSMHSAFLDELRSRLGRNELHLPRVFLGGHCIGGANEILQLHETGQLKKVLEGVPTLGSLGECAACAGMGFLLCSHCNGSHKYYTEEGAFESCNLCNENGLIRCTSCCG